MEVGPRGADALGAGAAAAGAEAAAAGLAAVWDAPIRGASANRLKPSTANAAASREAAGKCMGQRQAG